MSETADPGGVPGLSSRRIFFQGLGALGVAVALAGCAGGGASSTPAAAGDELVETSKVPVGGGVILTDHQIVVTQPSAGQFIAFTAVCTHEGNIVTSVTDGKILCAYHGSSFSAATGQVEGGPAPSPLAEVPIKVSGASIITA